MKKLYRKGTVHPSPSPLSDQLSLSYLPAAILTLTAALSADDRVVLAYLLSCSSTPTPFDFHPSKSLNHRNKLIHHPPSGTCYCFNCYTSYWARWDSSPNRQLIHEIIDAFEDGLVSQKKSKKQGINNRKSKRKNNNNSSKDVVIHDPALNLDDVNFNGSVRVNPDSGRVGPDEGVEGGDEGETGGKQGSVRKIVSFIGERIWGSVWG